MFYFFIEIYLGLIFSGMSIVYVLNIKEQSSNYIYLGNLKSTILIGIDITIKRELKLQNHSKGQVSVLVVVVVVVVSRQPP